MEELGLLMCLNQTGSPENLHWICLLILNPVVQITNLWQGLTPYCTYDVFYASIYSFENRHLKEKSLE